MIHILQVHVICGRENFMHSLLSDMKTQTCTVKTFISRTSHQGLVAVTVSTVQVPLVISLYLNMKIEMHLLLKSMPLVLELKLQLHSYQCMGKKTFMEPKQSNLHR